jgi:hypothetical protein
VPAEAGATLVVAAREAFLVGLRICAAITTLGSLALAAFVFARLRGVRPGAAPAGGH